MDDDILLKMPRFTQTGIRFSWLPPGSVFHGIIVNSVGNLKAGQSVRTAINVPQY